MVSALRLQKTLPNFYQYVSCPTRRDKILDLCYGSIKNAYKSVSLPPLGSADHNCVHLLPIYKTALKKERVQTRDVKVWTEDSTLCLQECFDCTDWDTFKNTCDDLDELTDVCCSYAVFCKDMIIPSKTVKMYPNNKPWVTSAVKGGLVKKRLAFQQGSLADQHAASRELKTEISKAKNAYKSKMEDKAAIALEFILKQNRRDMFRQ